ncbi:hypothetical protein FRC07_005131 [Ceratobasidium sp. 392]|nr:hypothetical protein FRC07_005131 [Ceratobasidium sp. 392]
MPNVSSNRAFNNPELLGIICDHAENTARTLLARTSRLMFGIAAPRIWKSLDSVQPLLMLLSPTVARVSAPTKHLQITLPPYSPEAFVRFDLYSSSVRYLAVSKVWSRDRSTPLEFRLSSWETLAQRAQNAPLLLNLLELGFPKQSKFNKDILLWLSVLLPPTLQNLDIHTDHLNEPIAATTLALLAHKCSGLKSLGFDLRLSSTPVGSADPSEETILTQLVHSPIALGHLQSLKTLACLSVHGHFINTESFTVISRLPNLRDLRITSISSGSSKFVEVLKSTRLSDDSFPAITTLRVASHRLDTFLAA